MKLFGDAQSGNCYKIQLLASLLEIKLEWVEVDILAGESRTPAFLQANPNGKIPLLELDDGRLLAESNAILNYLAQNTALLPSDHFLQAQVLQWQFFEQYSHEPYIAVARYIAQYLGLPDDRLDEYHAKQAGGHNALSIMEHTLEKQDFLVGHALTIADLSLFAYTHVAHEGGFSLEQYPGIQNWIKRISTLDRFIPMQNPG